MNQYGREREELARARGYMPLLSKTNLYRLS